jgi:prepilin-type N-terminal cleavage/methylation domain-containing protein
MKRTAFTLVELLVVIAIIGLLSTIAVVALNGARLNSRDTKRIADLKQIRLALSLYYDANGYYPPSGCGYDCNGYLYSYDSSWDTLTSALAPYMAKPPKDPINSACPPWSATPCYSYAYGNVGRNTYPISYDLSARLESTSNPERCELRGWRFARGCGLEQYWCTAFGGAYNNQMYEVPSAD